MPATHADTHTQNKCDVKNAKSNQLQTNNIHFSKKIIIKNKKQSLATSAIPALGKQKQEGQESKPSLSKRMKAETMVNFTGKAIPQQ